MPSMVLCMAEAAVCHSSGSGGIPTCVQPLVDFGMLGSLRYSIMHMCTSTRWRIGVPASTRGWPWQQAAGCGSSCCVLCTYA